LGVFPLRHKIQQEIVRFVQHIFFFAHDHAEECKRVREPNGYFASWAQRNPLLPLLRDGLSQSRLATRQLPPPLYHEPPRRTRNCPEEGPVGSCLGLFR
jgi:hypothetical protein